MPSFFQVMVIFNKVYFLDKNREICSSQASEELIILRSKEENLFSLQGYYETWSKKDPESPRVTNILNAVFIQYSWAGRNLSLCKTEWRTIFLLPWSRKKAFIWVPDNRKFSSIHGVSWNAEFTRTRNLFWISTILTRRTHDRLAMRFALKISWLTFHVEDRAAIRVAFSPNPVKIATFRAFSMKTPREIERARNTRHNWHSQRGMCFPPMGNNHGSDYECSSRQHARNEG